MNIGQQTETYAYTYVSCIWHLYSWNLSGLLTKKTQNEAVAAFHHHLMLGIFGSGVD
jgi:hypothetical protein